MANEEREDRTRGHLFTIHTICATFLKCGKQSKIGPFRDQSRNDARKFLERLKSINLRNSEICSHFLKSGNPSEQLPNVWNGRKLRANAVPADRPIISVGIELQARRDGENLLHHRRCSRRYKKRAAERRTRKEF